MQDVGARIRDMRKARGMTLRQVSEACGIPASTLSNIESKDHAISLTNVLRIAEAFGVAPTVFLANDAARPPLKVPAGGGLIYDNQGLTVRQLTGGSDPSGLQVYLRAYQPGARQPWSEPHPGWEYIYVLSGQLDLLIEDEDPVRLSANDFFYFRSDRRHAVCSIDRSEVLLVCFGSGLLPHGQSARGGSEGRPSDPAAP